MHLATTRDLTGLLTPHDPPCVSLYQPTDRTAPGNQQNPIRFKNHLRERVDDGEGGTQQAELGERAYYKGPGDLINQFDKVTDRFFRAVDAAVLEHHSRPSGLPLMLAAKAENQPAFRDVTKNNFLMAE